MSDSPGFAMLLRVAAAVLMVGGMLADDATAQTGRGNRSLGSTWYMRQLPRSGSTNITIPVPGAFTGPGFFGGVSVGRGPVYYYTRPYYLNNRWSNFACNSNALFPVSPLEYGPPYWNDPRTLNLGISGYTAGTSLRISSLSSGVQGFNSVRGIRAYASQSNTTPESWGQFAPVTSSSLPDSQAIPIPPVDLGDSFLPGNEPSENGWSGLDAVTQALASMPAEQYLQHEFLPTTIHTGPSTSIDQQEGQRLQMRGDQALQEDDVLLAATLYQAAVHVQPKSSAAWLRMTWAHVFQQEYDAAASALKRALQLDSIDSADWIHVQTVLQTSNTDAERIDAPSLWTWVLEQPSSADRLLLAAAVLGFASDPAAAQSTVELARSAGASASSCLLITAAMERQRAALAQ